MYHAQPPLGVGKRPRATIGRNQGGANVINDELDAPDADGARRSSLWRGPITSARLLVASPLREHQLQRGEVPSRSPPRVRLGPALQPALPHSK